MNSTKQLDVVAEVADNTDVEGRSSCSVVHFGRLLTRLSSPVFHLSQKRRERFFLPFIPPRNSEVLEDRSHTNIALCSLLYSS